jgi:hypothetical protein
MAVLQQYLHERRWVPLVGQQTYEDSIETIAGTYDSAYAESARLPKVRNVLILRSGHSGVGSFGTSRLMDVGLTILLDRGMQGYRRGGNGQATSLPLKIYCIGTTATT